MKVFVAGGSGTIGVPLVRALVAAGHEVTALTRSLGKRDELLASGASVAVADALNRDALIAAVEAARPTRLATVQLQSDEGRGDLALSDQVDARRTAVGRRALI